METSFAMGGNHRGTPSSLYSSDLSLHILPQYGLTDYVFDKVLSGYSFNGCILVKERW
jgi:hypothetical protein